MIPFSPYCSLKITGFRIRTDNHWVIATINFWPYFRLGAISPRYLLLSPTRGLLTMIIFFLILSGKYIYFFLLIFHLLNILGIKYLI